MKSGVIRYWRKLFNQYTKRTIGDHVSLLYWSQSVYCTFYSSNVMHKILKRYSFDARSVYFDDQHR